MEHGLIAGVPHQYSLVGGTLQAPGIVRIVERVGGDHGMEIHHRLVSQRLVPQSADRVHRQVVVENHLFASIPRPAAGADHFRRHRTRGRRAFQLTGSDCLLDQGVDDELVARVGVGHAFRGGADPAMALAVDAMQRLVNAVGQQVDERATAGIPQGKLAIQPRAGKLERQPPLLGALHAGGDGKVAQFVPVQVTAINRGTHPLAEHLVEPVTMVDKQLGERLRRTRQLHNYQFREK